MFEAHAVIVNARGLHARPASVVAKYANAYKSDIVLCRGKREANAKSIASLLILAAAQGTKLTIRADGKDEKKAVAALLELIASGFNDDAVVNNPQKPEKPPTPAKTKTSRTTKKTKTNNISKVSSMREISGIGITGGVVIGKAYVHHSGEAQTPRYRILVKETEAEAARFDAAVATVRAHFNGLQAQASGLPGAAEIVPFIHLYRSLLEDPEISIKPREDILLKRVNAEWALHERVESIRINFQQMKDDYFRERGNDVGYVVKRLLAAMKIRAKPVSPPAGGVLVATDLDPASVINLRQTGYESFVTETGSGMSHSAILARSMNIVAVVGANGMLAAVQNGETIIVDAAKEVVIIAPGKDTLREYKKRHENQKPVRGGKRISGGKGVKSKDGDTVFLQTNIEFPAEVNESLEAGADGIGLFRTEFLFMNRATPPEEDEQFEIYRDVLKRVAGLPVTIRTLDLGADKLMKATDQAPSDNNPLGLRAIRYCLANPGLFLKQLRALLRVGAEYPNIKILLPMLSHPAELSQTMTLINHAREQVRATWRINAPLPMIGGMLEVPASIYIMRALAKHLSFFSIGTNDLIQYTMAADRGEEKLASLSDPLHPAILHLIAAAVDNAKSSKRPITLCGEIAGDANLTRMILSLGLRCFSMSSVQLKTVRECVRASDCKNLKILRRRLLNAPSPEAARQVLAT